MGGSGALRYATGEGKDPVTEEPRVLAEGEESRATILGAQGFGFAVESAAELEVARRVVEWSALPEHQCSRGKKCVKDCFHASLAWEKGQSPSKEQMVEAAQNYLKSMGMENA